LYNTFEEEFIKDEEFIYSLLLHFQKRIYLLHLYPYIKWTGTTSAQIKKTYLKTFFQVKDIYNKWVKKHKISKGVPEEEVANIVLYIEATRIQNHTKSKKVQIVTKEGTCWKKYIEAILKEKFGNKLEFQNYPHINT
ncbi:capsule biosynthesis protein, partial [Bacillus cereus]|uniref:PRD domain-containing protein n=1 Tax=Bacillus cereus TaxID=1396 RepID=UPI000C00A1A3